MANPMANTDTTTAPALSITRRFAAPREAVFRAWTDPGELAQWFGPAGVTVREVEVDLQPGGHYSLTMIGDNNVHALSGVYSEVKSPERLAFSWIWGDGEIAGVEMLVTIDFEETKDGGTLLTLTHERLPSPLAREHHEQGWLGCLDCLREHLAK